ncbi:uncharacterized protein LOC135190089 isoform X2 [Pogoniulus pusillus]|uniref:uncharacterized protein LOC135190088 isoform X2 n=1 Tax=Pogoniulus pusillus TaxID=488313 RepID=UPI0030B965FB
MVKAQRAVSFALLLLLVPLLGWEVEAVPWQSEGSVADAGMGRASASPQLGPVPEPTWHPRGPQRAKSVAAKAKSYQHTSEILKAILKDLEGSAYELGPETKEKETLQEEGHRPEVPVSAQKTGAGEAGRRSTNPGDAQDFQKYCIEGVVAVLGSVLFGMLLCCALCVWKRRRERRSAAV